MKQLCKQSLVISLAGYGAVSDQGIKATLGITESWPLRVRIAGAACYLDVDSAYPPGADAWKGPAVRRLRRYVSWVQYVVRQYSLHLPFRTRSMPCCAVSTKGPWYLHLWCTSYGPLRLVQEGSYVQTGSVLKASRHEAYRARPQGTD